MSSDDDGNTISNFIRTVQLGQENALAISKEDLKDGGKGTIIALQNRQLQPEPPVPPLRSESPRRAHVFHDVEGFAAYLERYGTADTVVLADVEAGIMSAVLDEKAQEGFEVVFLNPAMHPLFLTWQTILGHTTEIANFAGFLLANRRQVVEPDGHDLALTFSQVRASTSITVNRGRGNRCINGVMVETEIQGEKKNEPVDLPDSITIEVPLFVNTPKQRIEIDLLVSMRDEVIVVAASSALVMEARTTAFLAMLEKVSESKKGVVSLGAPHTAPWSYLRP